MAFRIGLRWQIALVVALFLGSLAALLSTSLAALWLPGREDEARRHLSAASRRMAEAAAPLLGEPGALDRKKPPPEWRRLADVTRDALADLPGVEGGFYLAGGWDEFTGYAFPNDPNPPPEPAPPDKVAPHDDSPPPRERSVVLAQVRDSLTLEPGADPVVQVRYVSPSRVMIVTEPVGRARPAHMATWVMVRLIGPEQQALDVGRLQIATGLALAGLLLGLALTANLGQNLRRERQERERLREELRRAEHLAVLGKLLAGVAHEVRNPLAAIRSTAQLCQRLPEQARAAAALDPILAAVDRLNALVGRLLFFVRSGYDERRPIDLNAVVREALALQSAQAETQGVAVKAELDSHLGTVSGSASALQQVVLNLITNALQAMPAGGTLSCRTRRRERPGVELCVADTGPGLGPAERAHLFEPFFTTRAEGTGLGLALCREIVQQHGGQIELDEQQGWGAVFRVTLPLGGL